MSLNNINTNIIERHTYSRNSNPNFSASMSLNNINTNIIERHTYSNDFALRIKIYCVFFILT